MPESASIPNVFQFNGKELDITEEMLAAFDTDGFIVVKNLFSQKELEIIEEALTGPGSLTTYSFGNSDGEGRQAKMCLWNNAGEDTTGMLARSEKMAGTATKLLRGEVYHYHSKLVMKEAETGGKFIWHQDYGYWYNFGCMFPDLVTAFVAIDRCGRDNGCLQILRGSHKCGRIDHVTVSGQVGADLERVAELEKQLEKVHVELNPGDTMFFHCNVLHTSSRNDSPYRRWALLSCYNRRNNTPRENVHYHPTYQPLTIVDNCSLVRQGVNRNLEGKDVRWKKFGEGKLVPVTEQ